MTLRPVATTLLTVLFALAGLMATGGASAQSADNSMLEARPTEAQRTNTAAASMRAPDDSGQSAAAPAEAAAQSDRPAQLSEQEREIARAKRLERREIISEGIGISIDDLNDLLRRVRPTAEERRQGD